MVVFRYTIYLLCMSLSFSGPCEFFLGIRTGGFLLILFRPWSVRGLNFFALLFFFLPLLFICCACCSVLRVSLLFFSLFFFFLSVTHILGCFLGPNPDRASSLSLLLLVFLLGCSLVLLTFFRGVNSLQRECVLFFVILVRPLFFVICFFTSFFSLPLSLCVLSSFFFCFV